MSSQSLVSDFLSQRKIAVVGMSRSGKGFGNVIFKELKSKGYRVFPVHPQVAAIDGNACARSVGQLSEKVDGVVLVVPPKETEKVVREVVQAGILRVWMQQGSASADAIRHCEENKVQVVHGHCILMFLEPVASIHKFHRWIWRVLGKLPR